MNVFSWLWLAAMVLFAIVEAATVSLVSLWFIGGSLAAFIAALLGAELWLQTLLFLLVSGVLLACLRPFVKKIAKPRTVATNFDRIVGQDAIVTEAIDNLQATGAIRIGGTEWTARSENGAPIAKDAVVKIIRIEGVKVFVTPAES